MILVSMAHVAYMSLHILMFILVMQLAKIQPWSSATRLHHWMREIRCSFLGKWMKHESTVHFFNEKHEI